MRAFTMQYAKNTFTMQQAKNNLLRTLFDYIKQNDIKNIKKFRSQGYEGIFRAHDKESGDTVLHLAAFKSDVELLQFFIREGAEVDARNHGRITPLMVAAHHGFIEAVTFLISQSADVNAVDKFGQNALWYCFGGTERHTQLAKLLLERDAALEHNHMGKPLIVKACEKGHKATDIVSILIAHGADVNETAAETGRTALIEAARRGASSVVALLLEENASPTTADIRGVSAVHESAYHGHVTVLQILAGYGTPLDEPAYNGNTPLHLAASAQQLLSVRYLCQHGSNTNAKNSLGLTPKALCKKYSLKAAAKEMKKAEKQYGGMKDKAPLLYVYEWIQSNKDKLQTSLVANMTPEGSISREDAVIAFEILHAPVTPESAEKFFDAIDAQKTGKMSVKDLMGDKYIPKPFTRATYEKEDPRGMKKGGKGTKKKKKAKKPKLKLPKEVKITICCGEGETQPKHFADNPYVNVHIATSDHLAYAKSDTLPATPFADDKIWTLEGISLDAAHFSSLCHAGDYDSVVRACRNGLNVNLCDTCYKTPLMFAASAGNWDIVQLLLAYGANPSAVDNFGWSALHYACRNGHSEIVKELLKSGAPVNAHTLSGASPLMKAIESNDVESVICCVLNGANLKAKTVCGLSVKDYARTFGDYGVYKTISRFLKAYKGGRKLTADLAAVDPDTELVYGKEINLYGKNGRNIFRTEKMMMRGSFLRQVQTAQLPLRAIKPKAVKAMGSPQPGQNQPENTVKLSTQTNLPLPPEKILVSKDAKPLLTTAITETTEKDHGAFETNAFAFGPNKEANKDPSTISASTYNEHVEKPVPHHREPFTDVTILRGAHSSQVFVPSGIDDTDPKLLGKRDQARKFFAMAIKRFDEHVTGGQQNDSLNPHDVFATDMTKFGRNKHLHVLEGRTEMEKAAWAFRNHVDVQRSTDPVFYAPAPEDWYPPTRQEMAVRYHMQPGLFDRVVKASLEDDPLRKYVRQAEATIQADPKSRKATTQSVNRLAEGSETKRFSVVHELQRIKKLHPQPSQANEGIPRLSLMHQFLGGRKQKVVKGSLANPLGVGTEMFKMQAGVGKSPTSPNTFV